MFVNKANQCKSCGCSRGIDRRVGCYNWPDLGQMPTYMPKRLYSVTEDMLGKLTWQIQRILVTVWCSDAWTKMASASSSLFFLLYSQSWLVALPSIWLLKPKVSLSFWTPFFPSTHTFIQSLPSAGIAIKFFFLLYPWIFFALWDSAWALLHQETFLKPQAGLNNTLECISVPYLTHSMAAFDHGCGSLTGLEAPWG